MTVRRTLGALSFALLAAPALATEGGGGGGALITPDLGTIFWTGITFLILLVVLGKFAWKPLIGAIETRERSIKDSIDQARADREEAQALLQQHRDLLAESHRERAAALTESQREGEKLKGEILAEARTQREQLLAQTEAQVQAGMRQARAELRGVAVDLAIQAAGKLLSKNLDDGTQRRLVEEYLADLDASGDSAPPA